VVFPTDFLYRLLGAQTRDTNDDASAKVWLSAVAEFDCEEGPVAFVLGFVLALLVRLEVASPPSEFCGWLAAGPPADIPPNPPTAVPPSPAAGVPPTVFVPGVLPPNPVAAVIGLPNNPSGGFLASP